ncbi:hypothetical protein FKP32DRAFT_1674248 [Trametes sanguinea]|nr:hypothetical protein FKP32DRAFT_1674248 [Trametes sanguinea]
MPQVAIPSEDGAQHGAHAGASKAAKPRKKAEEIPTDPSTWRKSRMPLDRTIGKTKAMKKYHLTAQDLQELSFELEPILIKDNIRTNTHLYNEREVERKAWEKHGGPAAHTAHMKQWRADKRAAQEKRIARASVQQFQQPTPAAPYVPAAAVTSHTALPTLAGYVPPQAVAQSPLAGYLLPQPVAQNIPLAPPIGDDWDVGGSLKLLMIKREMPPWLWKACHAWFKWADDVLGHRNGARAYERAQDRERPMQMALLSSYKYPARPPPLPSSPPMDRLRAILANAPCMPMDVAHAIDVYGMQKTYIASEDLYTYEWDSPYLDRVFSALIEVLVKLGVGDEGWSSARWEVYDTYTRCFGTLGYDPDGFKWFDNGSHWLDGRYPTKLVWANNSFAHSPRAKSLVKGVQYNAMLLYRTPEEVDFVGFGRQSHVTDPILGQGEGVFSVLEGFLYGGGVSIYAFALVQPNDLVKASKIEVQAKAPATRILLLLTRMKADNMKAPVQKRAPRVPRAPPRVECDICSVSVLRRVLNKHKLTHTPNKEELMYRCAFPGCDARSLRRHNVVRHYLSQHTDICAFACQIEVMDENGKATPCPFVTSTSEKLSLHRWRSHREVMAAARRDKWRTVPRASLATYVDDTAYVLPPLASTRSRLEPGHSGTSILDSGLEVPHSPKSAKDRKSVDARKSTKHLSETQTNNAGPKTSSTTLSTTTRENISVPQENADPIPAASPRPTLVPLKELERIHLERFGYPVGCPEQLRGPQAAAEELVIAPLVLEWPQGARAP